MSEQALLTCPIRGALTVSRLAKDVLTVSEESHRIDCIKFLLNRDYDKRSIEVETIVIKNLGESGRNKLRADIIVYKCLVVEVSGMTMEKRLQKIALARISHRPPASLAGWAGCHHHRSFAAMIA